MRLLMAALLSGIAASPVQAELDILAVIQTRDYAVSVDTVRFVWEVLPDQVFYPDSFGGQPGTVDSAVFTIPVLWFPPSARIHYRSGSSPTRCETIPSLVQDSWYVLRAGTGAEPLIKFLRLPGIAEEVSLQQEPVRAWPNPFGNGVCFSGVSACLEILDCSGRVVCRLAPDARYWDGCGSDGQPVPAGTYIISGRAMPTVRLVRFGNSPPAGVLAFR